MYIHEIADRSAAISDRLRRARTGLPEHFQHCGLGLLRPRRPLRHAGQLPDPGRLYAVELRQRRSRLPPHCADRPGPARGRLGQRRRRMPDPVIEHLFRWRHHYEAGIPVKLHPQAGPDQP